MDNPVDFLDRPDWRRAEQALALLDELAAGGFRDTGEFCEIKAMGLRALGLVHTDDVHYAIVYEDSDGETWCEIGSEVTRAPLGEDTWGRKAFIATSASREREWPYREKAIAIHPGATVSELLQHATRLRDGLRPALQDFGLFTLTLHPRMLDHWKFQERDQAPATLRAETEAREKKLKRWAFRFGKFFRDAGFLAPTTALGDRKFSKILVDFDDALFEACPGVLAVVDDYDSLEDLIGSEERERLPRSSRNLDLRMLAVLDPARVWWSYRVWRCDVAPERARDDAVSAAEFVDTLSAITGGRMRLEVRDERDLDERRSEIALAVGDAMPRITLERVPASTVDFRDEDLTVPHLDLVADINGHLGPGGPRFEVFHVADEGDAHRDVYIVLLDEAERGRLARERGWTF